MRSSGTAYRSHLSAGLGRAVRLPVRGFLTYEHRFQTSSSIEIVVQNAGAALTLAADRRVPPFPATRTSDALLVEVSSDPPGRQAVCVICEDAPNDAGFRIVDPAHAGLVVYKSIPVSEPAGRHAFHDPAEEAPDRLVAQIDQKLLPQRTQDPDQERVDLTGRDCVKRNSEELKFVM